MTRRLLPSGVAITLLCLPISIALSFRVGVIFFVPYVVAASVVVLMGALATSGSKAEYWLFAGDLVTLFAISAVVALTGGSESPAMGLLLLILVAVAGRHTPRGLLVFVVATLLATTVACAVATNRGVDYADLRLGAFLTTTAGIAVLIFTLTRAEREYRQQALVDPLTGVLNRLALTRRVEELRAQAAVGEGQLCVIAADIDNFKHVNDTRGHDAGDAVLREVALALRTNLRAFPLLYRTGGEEFVAVLPGLSRQEGQQIAERLRTAVERARPNDIPVTMSFGVASSARQSLDPESVLRAADDCLYRAKQSGRNRVIADGESGALGAGAEEAESRQWMRLPFLTNDVLA